jgi:hypothetical protein
MVKSLFFSFDLFMQFQCKTFKNFLVFQINFMYNKHIFSIAYPRKQIMFNTVFWSRIISGSYPNIHQAKFLKRIKFQTDVFSLIRYINEWAINCFVLCNFYISIHVEHWCWLLSEPDPESHLFTAPTLAPAVPKNVIRCVSNSRTLVDNILKDNQNVFSGVFCL